MTIKEVSEKYGISQDTLRYYERVGVIPDVKRTSGGIRNYSDEDLRWVCLAKCMRNSGLPLEMMVRYVQLTKEGEKTIPDRMQLLIEQRDALIAQKNQIDEAIERLNNNIARYEARIAEGAAQKSK